MGKFPSPTLLVLLVSRPTVVIWAVDEQVYAVYCHFPRQLIHYLINEPQLKTGHVSTRSLRYHFTNFSSISSYICVRKSITGTVFCIDWRGETIIDLWIGEIKQGLFIRRRKASSVGNLFDDSALRGRLRGSQRSGRSAGRSLEALAESFARPLFVHPVYDRRFGRPGRQIPANGRSSAGIYILYGGLSSLRLSLLTPLETDS